MKDNNWTRFIGVGLQLASGVLLGLFGGYWADKKFGTAPWLMLAGTAAGGAGGFYALFREFTSKD